MRQGLIAFWISLLWAASPLGAAPQQSPGQSDKSCLGCHDASRLAALKAARGPEIVPEDPRERAAFAALVGETDPRRRKQMAEQFLAGYPQSWVLEPVYEIASKASAALGDLQAALDYGARSLRLLPENPFLLLTLADVQTKTGDMDAAARSAQDAAWYLNRFDRPSSMDERTWPQIKQRLLAQSYFDVGRAAASEGLAATGEARTGRLADAESALRESLRFDPESPGAPFLLAMVELGQNRAADAAGFFALVAKSKGPLAGQALDRLHAIYGDGGIAGGQPFEQWLSGLKPLRPPPAAAMPRTGKLPSYAGSDACRDCHRTQHSSWQTTGMGRMFRPYRPEDVIGDFTSGQTVPDDQGKPVARAVVSEGKHFLEIRAGEKWNRYPVQYLIGSKWQQGYATRLPGGEIQVFPLQYSRVEKRWVNYWKIIDAEDSPRTNITRFHEVVPGATYQLDCAPCHTSQERFEGAVIQAKTAYFREGGINCEMCHGPSATHVAAMRTGKPYKKDAAEPPVDFQKIPATEYVAICGQCHMQSGERDPEPAGAFNYSESGDKFYRTLSSRPYVDYSRKAFYKDGRFRETVFIVESFVRSGCFRKGGAQCGSCHDPHPADAASNPTSLKFRSEPDRMCTGCHTKFQANPQTHTHHAATGEGSRCVSCHMPRIMNALLFQARSHQIDDIPDPGMTERFGPKESPNACLLCHQDRDARWLRERIASWVAKR
ncbi:MAG TPA: cytochrome c3 family protein [Bryobacteraceae bacterium]|jgi:predicted CXXCH cytochrome family protein|nr:cytochrome c3 family protein [Bryobacteraceae bacterium]